MIKSLLCAFALIVEEPEQPFMCTVIHSKKIICSYSKSDLRNGSLKTCHFPVEIIFYIWLKPYFKQNADS